MTVLAFRCGYTRREDKAGDAPCGRPATDRRRGEPRCFGHWAAVWLGADTDHYGRSVHQFILALALVAMSGQLVVTVRDGLHEPVAVVVLMIALICWSAGSLIAVGLEHPIGGAVWSGATPFAALALLWSAATIWFGHADTFLVGSMGESRLGRALVALYSAVFAIYAVIDWARFLLYLRGRGWGRDYLALVGDLLIGAVLLIAGALAVASHGSESTRLVYVALIIGAFGVARSARRIKEFVRRFRI